MARRRGYRELVEADLDIMPLMNLFVVLIPMLLLSAVFVEISTIDMNLPPSDSEFSGEDEGLQLSVRMEPDRYVVHGHGIRTRTVDRSGEDAADALTRVLVDIARQHPEEHAVRIESAPAERYQEIVAVMDIGRDAGLASIGLAGLPDSGRSPREAR